MKVFHVKKKKQKISECDGMCADMGTATPIPGQIPGMGPVTVTGGPDRWDNIIGQVNMQATAPKRKRYKVKKHGK